MRLSLAAALILASTTTAQSRQTSAGSYIRVEPPHPVPAEGTVRILIDKTYPESSSPASSGSSGTS